MQSYRNQGFTLIELMVIVVILTILVAIAIPSYRSYTTRNAEADAKKQMLLLANQLEGWRAKALTYNGFKPLQIINIEEKLEAKKELTKEEKQQLKNYNKDATIDVPLHDSRYTIKLGKISSTSGKFESFQENSIPGTSWTILATPKKDITGGVSVLLNSKGLKCQVIDKNLKITAADCGAKGSDW